MTTKTEEDGTVSSFATLKVQIIIIIIIIVNMVILIIIMIKVEVGGDAERVRAECRALDDQLGERRSQWRVTFLIITIIDNYDGCNDYDDNDNYEDDIDRVNQVVPIYPPLSSAKVEGLHEGAKLNQVHCHHHCGQHHYDYLHVHDQHRYCYQYHHDQHCLMILITRAT